MMYKAITALSALAVSSALVVPTVSQAAPVNSVRVSYADLDLATDFGQGKLQRRISFAAETVCGSADPRDLYYSRAVGVCRTGTIADAQPAFQEAVARVRHGTVTVLDSSALIVTAH
jgi:UrcA family protein